jgi:hypothetical protein
MDESASFSDRPGFHLGMEIVDGAFKAPRRNEKTVNKTLFSEFMRVFYPQYLDRLQDEWFYSGGDKPAYENTLRRFSRRAKACLPLQFLKEAFKKSLAMFDGYAPRCYSFHELISNMKKDSSSGYPYFTNKGSALASYPGQIYDWYCKGVSGTYCTLLGVWMACQKNEALTTMKEGLGVRNFIANHLPGYISTATHLQPQSDFLHDNHEQIPIKVGISKYNGGPRRLMNTFDDHCRRTGYPIVAFDISSMEYDFPTEFHQALAYARSCLDPDFDWQALYDDISDSKLLDRENNIVIRKRKGNNSGHGGTIDDNSWAATVVCYIAYHLQKSRDGEEANWASFMRDCKLAVVGDDGVICSPVSAKDLQRTFALCGFTLKIEGESFSTADVPFLSMTMHDGKIVSTHPDKMLAHLLFSDSNDQILAQRVSNIHIELYNSTYERTIVEQFAQWLRSKHGISVSLLTAGEIVELYG